MEMINCCLSLDFFFNDSIQFDFISALSTIIIVFKRVTETQSLTPNQAIVTGKNSLNRN